MPDTNTIRKWKPIIEALGVKDEKLSEFLSEYAEHHAKYELYDTLYTKPEVPKKIVHPEIDPFGEENWDDNNIVESKTKAKSDINTLPVALKILSKLNLEGKNCTIEDGLPNNIAQIQISREQIFELNRIGLDYIQKVENVLMEEVIFSINKQLETHDNFRVNIMAQSISIVVNENTMSPRVVLMSRYQVD